MARYRGLIAVEIVTDVDATEVEAKQALLFAARHVNAMIHSPAIDKAYAINEPTEMDGITLGNDGLEVLDDKLPERQSQTLYDGGKTGATIESKLTLVDDLPVHQTADGDYPGTDIPAPSAVQAGAQREDLTPEQQVDQQTETGKPVSNLAAEPRALPPLGSA